MRVLHWYRFRRWAVVVVLLAGIGLVPQVRDAGDRCLRAAGGFARAVANSGGPPLGRTGAPGELTCATAGCHGTSTVTSPGQVSILGLPSTYTPGTTYDNLQVKLEDPSAMRWGFQLVAKTAAGAVAGTLTPADTAQTQVFSGYLEHKTAGTFAGTGTSATWGFSWTAPTAGTGAVTFHAAGNAANNNGIADSGDRIYTAQSSAVAEQAGDATPPTAVGNLTDGGQFTTATTALSFSFTAATDGQSGVAEYSYSIGTDIGATNVRDWTTMGTATSLTATDLTLTGGQQYFINVRAKNGDGLAGPVATTDGITVDTTAPVFETGAVMDGAGADDAYFRLGDPLQANWTAATDGESNVAGYSVSLGTTAGAADLSVSTSVGTATSVTFTGVTLLHGQKAFVTVRAENGAGLVSSDANSDGVTALDPASPCNVDGQALAGAFDPTSGDLTALLDIIVTGNDPNNRCTGGKCNLDAQQGDTPNVGDAARLLDVIGIPGNPADEGLLVSVCRP